MAIIIYRLSQLLLDYKYIATDITVLAKTSKSVKSK